MFDNIKNIEKEYINNQTRFLIEEKLLYSFSKYDLRKFIDDTYVDYNKQKLLYITNLNNREKEIDYINNNQLGKYYIEQIEFYFNWGFELEKTKIFLERLKRFYKLNYVISKNNNYKKIDINSIPITEILSMYIKLPYNLNRNCRCPLHKESSWSFRIYKNTNSFYCFWCHKWWNIINFISEIENISINEAFKKILKLYW